MLSKQCLPTGTAAAGAPTCVTLANSEAHVACRTGRLDSTPAAALEHNGSPRDRIDPALVKTDRGEIPEHLRKGLAALGGFASPALLLSGCGGSDASPSVPTVGVALAVAPAPVPISRSQAARFLGQASMGATAADIAHVQTVGFVHWIDEQLITSREASHWDWLTTQGYDVGPRLNDPLLMDLTVWRQAIVGKDQLRQRVGNALLDIFVVGVDGFAGFCKGFAMAAYIDLLMDGVFGNFRALLGSIAENCSMGSFLTFINSSKADARTGTHPDENFARELMQLFTIGLYELNGDGTRKLQDGKPIETYTLDDVTGLAKVFTGWNYAPGDLLTREPYRLPVILNANEHESGTKAFLGTVIPSGTDGFVSRTIALDALFFHSNAGPFFCRQLIQRLVTSNPSAAYLSRISAVFANDGAGLRGNLAAVVRATLLDEDARADNVLATSSAAASPTWGRIRTPTQRVTGWARAFGAVSPSGTWPIGDLSTPWRLLGESSGHAPSVFNFFRPSYTPPGSALASMGLVAPEMQIVTEPTIVSYVNYFRDIIAGNVYANDLQADYTSMLAIAGDVNALVDETSLLLSAGQLTHDTVAKIVAAVSTISMTDVNGPLNRVFSAILLTMSSPEYLVQK